MSEKYTVLAVCTGNICRSPAMERLLAQLFADESEIKVISAGTHAHVGEDIQPEMKDRITDVGASAEGFTATQLTTEMIESSDLILAATRVHVEDILAEVPTAASRTFTLRQFGRILKNLDDAEIHGASVAEKLRALAEKADQQREAAGENEDVVDPYMLPDDVYDESFQQILEPIETLRGVLGR